MYISPMMYFKIVLGVQIVLGDTKQLISYSNYTWVIRNSQWVDVQPALWALSKSSHTDRAI